MHKRKELLIFIILIIISILIVFYNQPVKDKSTVIKNYQVSITLKGEINCDEFSTKIPKGYPLSFISQEIEDCLNEYSILDFSYDTVINEDTTIIIKTKDINNNYNSTNTSKININTSSLEELKTIYGIGEARAKKIIEYRETGVISSYEELKNLLGVSDNVLAKIKEQAIL